MRHLLLVTSISLITLFWLPATASGTGNMYPPSSEHIQQSASNTRITVHLNCPGQLQATHGQAPIGVIGCKFDFITGKFVIVYPGSDLLRYGIHPGDSYLAIEGQPTVRNINWFQDITRGTPGTYVDMTVLHDGRPMDIKVMRKDSRLFAGCNTGGNNYFIWCAGQTKYW